MADGEILYEVRASLDKLREDMLSAQDEAKKGGNKLADIAKAGGKAIAGGFAVVGGAAIAAGGYGVNLANDMDSAMNQFMATTGHAADSAEYYQDVLEKIYANNYGEDFQDIADSMALVNKNLGDMSAENLQSTTEAAFALRDTFDYDITESTRAAKAMMDNFGVSGEEAFELIASGAQNNLDYSGELIDSINEYSVQFGKLGFTADDMFNIFQKGADSGAWNLDKVGDAVKEFSIRAIDGSDSTKQGFEACGLSADKMADEFGKGGESAKKAFSETVKALSSIEDPLERDAAGVALFGTMWEDLGPDVIAQLGDIEDGAYSTGNALEEIQDVKYDDLGSMLEGLKRSVEMLALPLGEALIPVLTELIEEVLPVIQEVLPDVIEAFETFLEPVLQLASEALPGIIDGFLQLMSDDLMPLMTEEILPALKEAFESLQPVFDLFKDEILPLVVDLFKELMPPIMELINNLIPPLVDVFNALAVPIIDFISSLLPSLKSLFEGVADVVDMLSPVIAYLADMFQDRLQTALNIVKPIVEHVIAVFKNIIDFIKNVFTGDWSAAWDNIVNIFKSCFNLIPTIAENVINGAIGVINSLINGVNKITDKIPGDPIGQIPTIGEVSLPRFHTGGIIDFKGKYESPIMALDGEMVLTAAQQKRLFDIANGAYSPESVTNSSNVNNHTDVKIEHKNYFTVRSDIDIIRISEELSRQDKKDIMSIGGD
ncbi:MAG: phage tail tape measure protein [Oscillospiraceae bacterium]